MRSKTALLVILFYFSTSQWLFSRWDRSFVLTWDISGYYLYLPAVFIYHDLSEINFLAEIDKKYPLTTNGGYGRLPLENGKAVMKFTMGMSVAYLPGFAVGHLIAKFTKYLEDGFSRPYQHAIAVVTMLYSFIGLLILRKVLLRYFTDAAVALSLLGIALGTNLFHYSTFDSAMSHGVLFMLYALIIFLSDRWHRTYSYKDSIMLGVCLGFISLIRPTEVISILIPALWGLKSLTRLKERFQLFWDKKRQLITCLFIAFCIGVVQLIYWKTMTGHWLFDSYKGEGHFTFLSPHILDGLFSYKKGWYIYTPLMLFATAGIYLVRRMAPAAFIPLCVFFVVNLYVVLSWNPWWYGGSFGMRAFIQMYAVMSFGLAALITKMYQRQWQKELALLLVAACIYLNLFQTWQYHNGIIHWEDMTKEKYWDIFLKS